MSSLKTIVFVAAIAVAMAGFFKVGGLKFSNGILIGGALVLVANFLPESQPAA